MVKTVKKENKYTRESQLIRALRDQHQIAWNESKKAQNLEVALAAELYVLWSTGLDEGDPHLSASISGGALEIEDDITKSRIIVWTEYCHDKNIVQYVVDGEVTGVHITKHADPVGAFVRVHGWFRDLREKPTTNNNG